MTRVQLFTIGCTERPEEAFSIAQFYRLLDPSAPRAVRPAISMQLNQAGQHVSKDVLWGLILADDED